MFNRMSYDLVTAPAIEPVSLAEVKAFLRIDGVEDDSLLAILIASARTAAEEYTKRAFLTQTWRLTLDSFATDSVPTGVPPFLGGTVRAIQLSRRPIQSIASIKTTDTAGVQTTVAASVYRLDAATGQVLLNEGMSWPAGLRAQSAVAIEFVAGATSAAAVPAPIRQGILQHVAASYADKMCADIPAGARAAYDLFRLPEAFGVL